MDNDRFRGVGTAMITPFQADGSIDFAALEGLIARQIAAGINFLVPLGTTGETPTLDLKEQEALIAFYQEKTQGQMPLLVGCGGNDTRGVIRKAKRFRELGVTHLLVVSPYYNKPNQEGVYRHFQSLREETGLEILLYSVQGRTSGNVEPKTVERLVEQQAIFGIKEASGNLLQIQEICLRTRGRLLVFSGDDISTLPIIAMGGSGVVSVASNVVPEAVSLFVRTLLEGDYPQARSLLAPLAKLFHACFLEPNPIPVKGGAALLGWISPHYRLPMVPPDEALLATMKKVLTPFYPEQNWA